MTSCPVARALGAVPRRRLPPAERRSQIIEAAKALLGEGGIERLSMRNIARRVGITQAAIYQHFADKEAILFAIAEDFFGRLIEDTQRIEREVADPVERLRRSMRNYVENGLSHPDEYRLVFMTHVPGLRRHGAHRPVPGEAAAIQPTKGQIAYGHMQEQVRELIASGTLREGDPEVVAEALWAAGHGIVALLVTHVDFPWSKDKLFDTQMDMLFRGLLPEGSPSREPG
jgi:AcrR family transcriptional regulator